MKKILILLSFSLVAFSFSTYFHKNENEKAVQQSDNQGFAIVELFTSEGCSSCPSADEVLSGLVGKSNVFPLGFHVTYWNRLGWKDQFSQKIFDERQYAYGERFNLSGVYTPQIVVNGSEEMVGSKKSKVLQSIENQLKNAATYPITLSKNINNGQLEVAYQLNTTNKDLVLNFALTQSKITTKVKNGENEGRTLHHDNVVLVFKTIPVQSEGKVNFDLPQSIDNLSVIAFLQEKNLGKIVAAQKLQL